MIATEQLKPEVIEQRCQWDEKVKDVAPERFLFLDESNAKTTMTRLYGRAMGGRRVVDHVPDGRWESMTMLGAIDWLGSGPCLTYSGGTDVPTMLAYVQEMLVPILRPEHIVVMDNLASHKHPSVIAAIEKTGAQVWFLPPYSPDLNPIEKMWSKVKTFLRAAKARTTENLLGTIRQALESITPSDAQNWYKHSGYQTRTPIGELLYASQTSGNNTVLRASAQRVGTYFFHYAHP